MALGATQVFDGALRYLVTNANSQWDVTAGAGANFTFALLDNSWTPTDVAATWSIISANECVDVDYGPLIVTTRAIGGTGANCYLDSADANFGAAVTIAARYLVCVHTATAATLVAGDIPIFYIDLNDGGAANVSSTSSDFSAQPTVNGWLNILQA